MSESLRARWAGFEPQTKAAIVSVLIAFAFIIMAKGPEGDLNGSYSDHMHHSHITWAMLHVGTDVYTKTWAEAAKLAPPYPQDCVTWEQYPNPYPPGMSVVFLLPALVGKYVTLERQTFGKLVIVYLLMIMTAANWHIAGFMRRVKSPVWTAVLATAWIFNVRAALLGFYDGAWLLTGLLSVRALERKDHALAVLYFVACALINYRAVSFTPFGVMAFWGLLRGSDLRWKKVAITAGAVLAAIVVVTTFYWMLKGAPHDKSGAESPLLPLKFRGWALLLGGLATAGVLSRTTSRMTGITLALSTILCIIHGGHSWHGMLCFPPLIALSLAERRPVWAQIVVGVWMLVLWRFAMAYEPFVWLEEVFHFFEHDGVNFN